MNIFPIFNFFELAFLLQTKTKPGADFEDYFVDISQVKRQVVRKMEDRDFSLLSLNSGKYERIDQIMEEGLSKIYLFHSECSACQLKSLFARMKIDRIFDKNKSIVIFSVMADTSALEQLIENESNPLKIYLDFNDEFGLFTVITDDKKNPIIIDNNRIKGEKTNE
jgi:hypothetical protein